MIRFFLFIYSVFPLKRDGNESHLRPRARCSARLSAVMTGEGRVGPLPRDVCACAISLPFASDVSGAAAPA